MMKMDEVVKILEKQSLMSLGTWGEGYPDNSVVCFAHDENGNLYFGSYSDTLKCKNIARNPVVAITVGTLQIHGTAGIVSYGTVEYEEGRKIYDQKFPQYKQVFELEHNELYRVEPLVIWNYNPSKGEMHRDVIILSRDYFDVLEVYSPHSYVSRVNKNSADMLKEKHIKVIMIDGSDERFILLCQKLDTYLNERVGEEKQRAQYGKYNSLKVIHDVILLLDGDEPIGCGSFKRHDDEIAEVKRVFVCESYRGKRYGLTIMKHLEQLAKEKGYKKLILETGKPLKAAIRLYKELGYQVISNYGPYKDMTDSICMEKTLPLK